MVLKYLAHLKSIGLALYRYTMVYYTMILWFTMVKKLSVRVGTFDCNMQNSRNQRVATVNQLIDELRLKN